MHASLVHRPNSKGIGAGVLIEKKKKFEDKSGQRFVRNDFPKYKIDLVVNAGLKVCDGTLEEVLRRQQ